MHSGNPSAQRAVAHLIAAAPFGGAESVVLALAAMDPDATCVVILHRSAGTTHPLAEQLRARGVIVDEIVSSARAYGAQVREIRAVLRRRGTSVLHTHGYHANVVGWLAARAMDLTVVGTVHGYLGRDLKERLYDALDRWVLARADAVICVSAPLRDQLLRAGVAPERTHLVPNGLDPHAVRLDRGEARRALRLPEDGLVVGWTGRLSVEKGGDLLLDAVATLRTPCTVAIVGDGPERASLEAHSVGLPPSPARPQLVGAVPAVSKYLRAFDVIVVSSRREGSPMAVLEAVAAGVPLVAFRVGGIGELLDATSAWLVPAGDTAALSAAIDDALGSEHTRQQRAAAAMMRLDTTHGLAQWRAKVEVVYSCARALRAQRRSAP